jgi:hypothetical protein
MKGEATIGTEGLVGPAWRPIEEVGSDGVVKLEDGGYVLLHRIQQFRFRMREMVWTQV